MEPQEFKVDGFLVWIESDAEQYLCIQNESNWKQNVGIPIKDGFSIGQFEQSEMAWINVLPETVKEFCVRLVKNSAFL